MDKSTFRREETTLAPSKVSAPTDNPPTEDDRERFEDAQQEYRAEQGRRADMAAVANHNNYATHGEKLSHYHFAMMKPGKAAREIQQLVINGNGGSRNLEGSEIIRYMTEKYEEISKKDLNSRGHLYIG